MTVTQGDRLAALLKARPHTYGQMLAHCISTSPHKRVLEWVTVHPEWEIVREKRQRDGLVMWSLRPVKIKDTAPSV